MSIGAESFVNKIGELTLRLSNLIGNFTLFLFYAIQSLFTTRLKLHKFFFQSNRIGVESSLIVILTGLFTGMVFALQSYIGFQRVGGEQFIGAVVALAMVR